MLIAIVVIAVIAIWAVSAYNGLVRMRNQCDEAFSTMDVYLKKRFDLVPNLVATVKGYAKHEAETLEMVIRARNAGMSRDEKMKNEGELSGALRQVFALGEAYPELKADKSFVNLQNQLQKLEEDIANSRKYYNGCVREYNNRCMTIPTTFVAKAGNFQPWTLYTVDDEQERQNVKVQF